jgi:hypothetical protein
MRCTTGKDESETPFMLPTRSLEQITVKHAGRDSPAALKFIVVAVRVVLLVMGLNGIVCWLQVIRMSAVVGLDFVVVSSLGTRTRLPTRLDRSLTKMCGTSSPMVQTSAGDYTCHLTD